MVTNPITTLFGLIAVLCPIVGAFFPEAKQICDNITTEAIGLGLITAADGVKRPNLSMNRVAAWLLVGTALFAFTACGYLSTARQVVAQIKDDGKTLIVSGCQDLEDVEVIAEAVGELVDGSHGSIQVAEDKAEAFCEVVAAIHNLKKAEQ